MISSGLETDSTGQADFGAEGDFDAEHVARTDAEVNTAEGSIDGGVDGPAELEGDATADAQLAADAESGFSGTNSLDSDSPVGGVGNPIEVRPHGEADYAAEGDSSVDSEFDATTPGAELDSDNSLDAGGSTGGEADFAF
ncbi:hypothetical protein [Parasphingorhabdus pacifica]